MPETQPRKMVDSAWAWAKAKGRVRRNEVHGEEEIRIVLTETFAVNNADVEETERVGTMEVQELTIYEHPGFLTTFYIKFDFSQ